MMRNALFLVLCACVGVGAVGAWISLATSREVVHIETVDRVAPFRAHGEAWVSVTVTYNNGVMDHITLPLDCDTLFVVNPPDSAYVRPGGFADTIYPVVPR